MGGFGFKLHVFGKLVKGTIFDPGTIGGISIQVPHDNGVIGRALNQIDPVNKLPGTLATAVGDTVKAPTAINDAANAAKAAADTAMTLLEKMMATLANAEHQAYAAVMAVKLATSSLAFNVIVALVITALVLLVLLLGAKLYRNLRPVSV